jgi:protein-S-isoprenylcysteine O-methyltransferase Ste14
VRSRRSAALGSALFLFLAPGTVAGLVPWLLTGWRAPGPGWSPPARWLGAGLVGIGVLVLLDAFARFVRDGWGTPSPSHPPERLVVSGLYRHVRNPMYVAVVATVAGQALLLHSADLLVYTLLLFAVFNTFVALVEEPSLCTRFGDEYAAYCRSVSRWWPRLRPWSE